MYITLRHVSWHGHVTCVISDNDIGFSSKRPQSNENSNWSISNWMLGSFYSINFIVHSMISILLQVFRIEIQRIIGKNCHRGGMTSSWNISLTPATSSPPHGKPLTSRIHRKCNCLCRIMYVSFNTTNS